LIDCLTKAVDYVLFPVGFDSSTASSPHKQTQFTTFDSIMSLSLLCVLAALGSTAGVSVNRVKPVSGVTGTSWSPSSWRHLPIKQPPKYPDEAKVEEVMQKLQRCSPLVFAGEVRTLQEELAKASLGQVRFVLR
jgi:hypothetical protein